MPEAIDDLDRAVAEQVNAATAAAPGSTDWDDWDQPERIKPPAIPELHLDGFDGPMDLLLDLAERQLVDLGKMSILDLALQFAAALEQLADRVPIERRADWVVLATRLVLLRTRLLFPANPEAAADAVREADIELRRITELQRMRAASVWLQARPQLGGDVFARPAPEETRDVGYVALMEACLVVLRGRPATETFEPAPVYQVAVPDLWRIGDAMERIKKMLPDYPEGAPMGAFMPNIVEKDLNRTLKARAIVASTFAAGLELAKQGVLGLDQDDMFEEVKFSGASSFQS
jgi:segregation and condensation protein A